MLRKLHSDAAIQAGIERGDVFQKGKLYYMGVDFEAETIGSKDAAKIQSNKTLSGKEVADFIQQLENANHYKWALAPEKESPIVMSSAAAPDSKYIERLPAGFDHISATVRDMKQLALDCKRGGRMSHGSIGGLVVTALKVADVLEKQHLDSLSKLLFTVEDDESVWRTSNLV